MRKTSFRRVWMSILVVAACDVTGQAPSVSVALPPALPSDVYSTLKDPYDAFVELCSHPSTDTAFPTDQDRVTHSFCPDADPAGVRTTIPTPHSLQDLLTQLGLNFVDPTGGNGVGGNPGFAILGHSSALTAREVSTITPTSFIFTPPNADGTLPVDYAFLAYDPGETFVEFAGYSAAGGGINAYLITFDKACSTTPEGCSPTDLLTPAQTTGWTNVNVYESTTYLNDTIFDCRECHIGAGSDSAYGGGKLMLRMQEMEAPHTHWFSSSTEGGLALLSDFHAAHGIAEDYGGIPAALIDQSDPDLMAQVITAAGFGTQPNAFPSAQVEAQVIDSAPLQPMVNVPMGWSDTWQQVFDAACSGQAIRAPYHDVKITDPAKLAAMTGAYQAWQSGASPNLTADIREVLLDAAMVDLGFSPPPGLDGRALLVQQCQECHNSNLDPTLSRERFLVDTLDEMSQGEKNVAIARLKTPTTTRLTMPPPLFRLPSDADRAAMIAALGGDASSIAGIEEPDPPAGVQTCTGVPYDACVGGSAGSAQCPATGICQAFGNGVTVCTSPCTSDAMCPTQGGQPVSCTMGVCQPPQSNLCVPAQ
jgi:hypothetical protein